MLLSPFRVINTVPPRGKRKTEDTTLTELQNYIDGYGFGIRVKELASRAYSHMAAKGHKVCIVNDRYLEVDGTTYLFSKSRKHGRWIAKAF